MRHSGLPRSAFSPKVQAQIDAAMARDGDAFVKVTGGDPATAQVVPAPDAPSLRQRQGPPLNKTEAAFLDHLREAHPGREVLTQDVTLRLGNGVRYTPDFFLPPKVADNVLPCAYEVKGFMRDDAAVKLKVAARAFPWIRFFLVSRKGRLRPWRVQEILP